MNAELAEFLSFLYGELGETTVRRWFAERRFARDAGCGPYLKREGPSE